jgi:hypothetical protein
MDHMDIMKRVSGAPVEMRKRGQTTDSMVFSEIVKKPGATISEIADVLGVSNGRVDGSISRLASKREVSVRHCIKRGMLVKMVFPADYPADQRDIVRIPKEMIDGNAWQNKGILYALSRSTLGVSPKEVKDWDERALFKETLSVLREKEDVVVKLPERLASFYQLENSELSLSAIGDALLLTVESVLPVKLPLTYPEEIQYRLTRYRVVMEREVIEAIPSFDPVGYHILREGKGKVTNSSTQNRYSTDYRNVNESIPLAGTTSENRMKPIEIPVKV